MSEPLPSSPSGSYFDHLAKWASHMAGRPVSFMLAVAVIVVWIVTGPLFKFSDTWQLVINTSTTIVTFLMVFLIQATQNRDMVALHMKLDELIRAYEGASNSMMDLDDLSEEQLMEMQTRYQKLAAAARQQLERDTPVSS